MFTSINSFGPFEAEIWGTVSDWMMIIVTAITALLIYKTFRAQLKVTMDQGELLKIERIKLKEQFRTELEASGGNTWDSVNTVRLNIKSINHPAYNIKIHKVLIKNFNREGCIVFAIKDRQIDFLKIDKWVNVYEEIVAHEDLNAHVNITITYEDVNGFEYSQYVHGTLEKPFMGRPAVNNKDGN